MKTIAFLGAAGGVGTTTLVAQLTVALATRRYPVLAIDLDEDNDLAAHFGYPLDEADGLARRIVDRGSWAEACYRNGQLIDFVPFGRLSFQERREFDEAFVTNPDWLNGELHKVDVPVDTTVLLDCGRWDRVLQRNAAARADRIFVVMNTGLVSMSRLQGLCDELERENPTATVQVLLNGFDPVTQLGQDVVARFRSQLGQRGVRILVHYDESLRQAYAQKQDVFSYAPSSQAAHDLLALMTWLTEPVAAGVA